MDIKSIVLLAQKVDTNLIAWTRIASSGVAVISGGIAWVQTQSQVLNILNPKIALYLTLASGVVYGTSSMLAHASDIEVQLQKDLDSTPASSVASEMPKR